MLIPAAVMTVCARLFLVSLFLVSLQPVKADCAFDIQELRARVARLPGSDPESKAKAKTVRGLLDLAEEARTTSEIECRNRLTHAWRVWRTEPARDAGKPDMADPYQRRQ